METTQPVHRRRHLMDPAHPQRSSVDSREITRVRQWVLSVLVTTTVLHLSAGLAIAGVFADGSRPGAGVGLNVLASVCGVGAVLAARLIHGRRPMSWWLLLGLVPGLVGLWFVLS
ncbi:MAG TPA: hypothetical protein VH085_09995 [Nocardioides sp.]|jgi:hypothetical protein|nr:hypothetical protein [Nocardioides sp.]